MVPSNVDADMRPTTPPPVHLSADAIALKDKEAASKNDDSSSPPADEANDKTGGDVDVIPAPVQNGVRNVDQKPAKSTPERKTTRRGEQDLEHVQQEHGHRYEKAELHHLDDSLLSQDRDEDHDMDHDGRHHSEEKYRRLKRKLKEVLEENERLSIALDRSNRRARNLRQEKNLLLDRLASYERDSDSSPDTLSSMSSDSELSDSSLNSFYRSRRSSPTRLAPPPANNKHLRVPGTGKGLEPSSAQVVHHPKKTATKAAAGRRSPAVPGRKEEKAPSTPSTITNVGSATQKPKRLHNTSKLKPALTMKVRKVQAIERDEAGNVKLPVTVGIITIMNLGHVVYDRDAFHNERYIWPVGYKMSRSYNSMIDPHQQTTYTCSVIDDGEAPKFQIDAEDQPGKPIIAGTATGAWTHIVKAANLIRKRDHSNSASGPDYFGFSNATIAKMIQDLPNADKCKSYIMQRFEEPSAKVSATPEKRKISTLGSKAGKGQSDEGHEGAEGEGEGEGDDDDVYASLGTPGKKKVKRSSSPKIRQAGFDVGAKDGGDIEMKDTEQEEEEDVDELAEEDEETQSEKGGEDVSPASGADVHEVGGAEDQAHYVMTSAATAAPTGPPVVNTSVDKTVSREATSESEMVEIEDADIDVDVSAEATPMARTTTSTAPETTTIQNA